MPLPVLNSLFDDLYPPGPQCYWKADFVDHLTDESIARHIKYESNLPSLFDHLGRRSSSAYDRNHPSS